MGEHSLKSLARLAAEMTRIGGRLGPARGTLLRDALRRALAGEALPRESLKEILDPLGVPGPGETLSGSGDAAGMALAGLEALLEAHRALAPRILSAALRGDPRLLALPREDLEALLPLWTEAARVTPAPEGRGYAHLFTQLAASPALAGSGALAPPLRRLFLRGDRDTGAAALEGLLHTAEIRPEDRRFFRRLDLHLQLGRLPEETEARLGAWVVGRPELREELIGRGSLGALRVRLRGARLLSAAALGADALTAEARDEVAHHLRRLLADPVPVVGLAAAVGAARLYPHPQLDGLWEPWFAGATVLPWQPRVAAGLGSLLRRVPEVAEDLLEALLAEGDGPPRDAAHGQWLHGLASGLGGLLERAPARAERVLEALEAAGDPLALHAAADALALARLRDGALPVEEGWLRRLDRALGTPEGRTPEGWARVLSGREALLAARGGRPATSLTQQARLVARDALAGEPAGRVLATLQEVLDQAAERLGALALPPPNEDTVVLGGQLHDLEDLVTALVEEDLLTSTLIALAVSRPEELTEQRERVRALQQRLRFELHRSAGDLRALPQWRTLALRSAARLAEAVPDDPLARPSPPRSVGFVQLVGLPDFARGVEEGVEPSAVVGLARVLDAVVPSATPGSGDALLALVLSRAGSETLQSLAGALSEARPLEAVETLARLREDLPGQDTPAEARVAGLLVTLEQLLGLPLEHGAFAAPRTREPLDHACRHVRTATGHERAISFMTPVRRSLEVQAEPLLVALARDLAALGRLAAEGGETARRVALHALGAGDVPLARAAAQHVSRVALESASLEAEAVVVAEGVGDAIRQGAAAAPDDRDARADALGLAARGLRELASLAREAVPGLVGTLFGELMSSWADLVEERRLRALEAPAHPLVIDRFHIERLLGEGGMAYTYLARDPALDRPVTLKVMKPEIARRPDLRRLFATEGRALAALPAHAHVVQVFEHLEAEAAPCLVMEFVDGESLADLIPAGGMTVRRGLDVAVAAAQGLHHVHRHQLVHLDVKAENVMVARDGAPKLIDFGLAQRENASRQTKMVLGTPVYMSPEQARGLALGPASDVYSCGVLLYEIFTGEVPFDDADPREILKAHVAQTPKPLSVHRPDLPDGLVLLVADMLQKSPDNRPWMVEVASRLARIRSALEPQEAAASALGRREIAVLCASLEGLRPDDGDPAEVASALEAFLAGAAEIVTGLGGRVDATVGERVFAVFGYPRDDAQAAVHAVRAATQLQRRLERLGLPGLSVRAGVAAGQALVGQVRGDPTDATVLGAPLWRAARLADDTGAAEPLLVDEPALELVRGLVEVGKRRSRRDLGRYYPVTLRD